jgi:hypothetical protein
MIPMGEGPGGERGFGKASKPLGHVAGNGFRALILTTPASTGRRAREFEDRTGWLRAQWDAEVAGRER